MIPFNLFTNTAWVLFYFFLYWPLASSVRLLRSDLSSLLSSSAPASITPSKSRPRRFLEASLWGACGLIGIAFAMSGWIADGLSEDGWRLRNLAMVEAGARLFPWNRFIRTKPGYFAMAYIHPSEASIELINGALRTDPFAPDLTMALAHHWEVLGNHEMATIIMRKFHRLAPNAGLVQ
jgi:hypothetical protein